MHVQVIQYFYIQWFWIEININAFHHPNVVPTFISIDHPISKDKFKSFLLDLVNEREKDLLRYKGLLEFEGEEKTFVLQV